MKTLLTWSSRLALRPVRLYSQEAKPPSHIRGIPTSLLPPALLPRAQGIPVALIHLRSPFPHLLSLFIHFILHTTNALGIPSTKPTSLPNKRSLYTVPKGPFAHKKSQENFERIIHKRCIKLYDANPEVMDRLVTYLESNPLGGVGMRLVRWERVPLGIGKSTLANALAGLGESMTDTGKRQRVGIADAVRVKNVGDQIIVAEMAAARQQQ